MEKLREKKALEIIIEDLQILQLQLLAEYEVNSKNIKAYDIDLSVSKNQNINEDFFNKLKKSTLKLKESKIVIEENIEALSKNIEIYKTRYNNLTDTIIL